MLTLLFEVSDLFVEDLCRLRLRRHSCLTELLFQSFFAAGLELSHFGRPRRLGVGLDLLDRRRDAGFCVPFDLGEFCLECACFAFGRQARLFVRLFSKMFRLRLNPGHLVGVLLGRLRSCTF